MIAYHFLRDDMRAGHGDEPAWNVGETRVLSDNVEISICYNGYHSSPTLYDAFQYAPGAMACMVEISDPIAQDADKYVSRSRTLVKAVDLTMEIRLFGAKCAEIALLGERKAGREPDTRSWAAIEATRKFAAGEITSAELSAARSAAWSAAESAARSAAWAAARSAAWAAAWSAAWSAAWAAAWSAARSAAWAAAESAQRVLFDEIVTAKLIDGVSL